jgi:5-methyltetrahydropteroyltriglutamate--homocysteine methyltransferase
MTELIFDDIGSFPLQGGIGAEWLREAIPAHEPAAFDVIRSTFRQKLDAGVDVATYPQFQDMNKQFLSILNNPECIEGPFDVKASCAKIVELEAIEKAAEEYQTETGIKPDVRVCVTGPLELYLQEFGGTSYDDILELFGQSIDKFVTNAIDNASNFNVHTVSIDEPSIGINPQVMFDDDEIINALEKASATASRKGVDVEIHLHSPLYYELPCRTSGINVIGVESAANPTYLELVDKKVLEETDSFLRAGVARTDIFNLVAILNEKYSTNAWQKPEMLQELVTDMETPSTILKRLEHAYGIFGDRIKYVGPDCGLGSWPTPEIASNLLGNVAEALDTFRN